MDLARRSETAIYPIGLMADADRPSRRASAKPPTRCKQLASDTGGRAFFPTDIKTLASIYGQIYDELSSQYTIGYTSKNAAPRRRLAAARGPRQPPERDRADQAGVLSPTR